MAAQGSVAASGRERDQEMGRARRSREIFFLERADEAEWEAASERTVS